MDRLPKARLAKIFVSSLGSFLIDHSPLSKVPVDVDLRPPLPSKIRVYLFNATHPPGSNSASEYKVRLVVPGQKHGEYGSFDNSDGRIVVVAGYEADLDVFILWDGGLYSDFRGYRIVQTKSETVYAAVAGKIGEQERQLYVPRATETVITARSDRLAEALELRAKRTRERILGE